MGLSEAIDGAIQIVWDSSVEFVMRKVRQAQSLKDAARSINSWKSE